MVWVVDFEITFTISVVVIEAVWLAEMQRERSLSASSADNHYCLGTISVQ